MSERLKYTGTSIVMQEVPDEVSLAISISGCTHRCEGCHSSYLWENKGRYLTDDIIEIVTYHIGLVTCICFMGGDQNIEELNECIDIAHEKDYKCCVYLGCDEIPQELRTVDYLKIGHYDKKYGGLDNPNTNQRMYKWTDSKYIDITERFYNVKNL